MKVGRKLFITLFIAVLLACVTLGLYLGGVFGNFFAKPRKFTISFMADDVFVGSASYTVEMESFEQPQVPAKDGYAGKWEEYSLSKGGDITVNAVYTPIDYTLKYIGNNENEVLAEFNYNIEGETNYDSKNLPKAPTLHDLNGEWPEEYATSKDEMSKFLIGKFGDIVVCPLYTSKNATKGIEYSLSDKGYTVTGYSGTESNVIIPECYKNQPVFCIGQGAFNGNNSLVSITLPSTLKEIKSGAFGGCNKLVAVSNNSDSLDETAVRNSSEKLSQVFSIQKGTEGDEILTNYGDFYFIKDDLNNNQLVGYKSEAATIVLPKDFNGDGYYIHPYALYRVSDNFSSNMRFSITIQENSKILGMGEYAFAEIEGLVELNINDFDGLEKTALYGCNDIIRFSATGNAKFTVEKSSNDLSENKDGLLIYDDSVDKTIFKAATNAILPSSGALGYTKINAYAFEGNQVITELVIPEFYTEIGASAFKDCNIIESVEINNANFLKDSDHFLGFYFGGNKSSYNDGCLPQSLKTITVNTGAIPDNAFYNAKSVKTIFINETISSIGKEAFGGCSALEDITIPLSGGTTNKSFAYFFGVNKPTALKNVTISSDNDIAEGAFKGFDTIERLDIPFIGTKIDSLDTLSTIFDLSNDNGGVPKTLKWVGVRSGELKENAFANIKSLERVELPSTVTVAQNSAFSGCSGLNKWPTVYGDEDATVIEYIEIKDGAFFGCTKLTGYLPDGFEDTLEFIGVNAFAESGLTFTYGEGEQAGQYIGTRLNKYLALISIDTTLYTYSTNPLTKIITSGVANDCFNLFTVKLLSEVEHILDGAFNVSNVTIYEVYNLSHLTVSKGADTQGAVAKNAYVVHVSDGQPSIVAIENGFVFVTINSNNSSLVKYIGTELDLVAPSRSTEYVVKNNVFKDNINIKSIEFANVKEIEHESFMNCTQLTSININGSLTTIDASTFKNCINLKVVGLSDSIKTIKSNAFANCLALEEISELSNITRIEREAFTNTKLTEIYIKAGVTVAYDAFKNNTSLILLFGGTVSEQSGNRYVFMNVNAETRCTYSFNTNGGQTIEPITAWYLTDLRTPTHENGYNFSGWFIDEELTISVIDYYGSYYIYENAEEVIFYAKWEGIA